MADLREWVEDVQVEAPACLDATIERAVKYAIQEFFEDSEAWVFTQEIALVEGQLVYPLTLPDDTYIFASDFAKVQYVDGVETLVRLDLHELGSDLIGRPRAFSTTDTGVVLDAVSEEVTCTVSVILKPTRNIATVPDSIANKYFEAIRSGVLMRIKAMSDKDWSDSAGANRHEISFRQGIARAKREAKKLRSRTGRPARFNKGFSW